MVGAPARRLALRVLNHLGPIGLYVFSWWFGEILILAVPPCAEGVVSQGKGNREMGVWEGRGDVSRL